MYKSTLELLRRRQPHSEYSLEFIFAKRNPFMPRKGCLRNSQLQTNDSPDLILISGWLIHQYDAFSNSTKIIQNWRNYSLSKRTHIDFSIGDFDECEYLNDLALYEYPSNNYDFIKSTVSKSSLLADGKFQSIELISNNLVCKDIVSFETENFFRHN